ncbi:hypothetical protein [Roseiconus lacunae]|uniref:hypothetical protein n=1 Tax=Roseiconus lacunae TaxID=2605694 RepID=UPI001E32FD04|nr:hypothetical protein [Roseiconus lacunae]MCD0462269.1 hypothetical protein [Roseiconus lacunae]
MNLGPADKNQARRIRCASYLSQRMYRQLGLTLVEVVAAMALSGALLSLVIIGASKNASQLKSAYEKREATQLLDSFLAAWVTHDFALSALGDVSEQNAVPVMCSGQYEGAYLADDIESATYVVAVESTESRTFEDIVTIRVAVYKAGVPNQRRILSWAEVLAPSVR